MNDDDLRDCFAMFKSMTGATAEECYKFAGEMLEERKQKDEDSGIAAVVPKRARKR
jgi:hypothetical protein